MNNINATELPKRINVVGTSGSGKSTFARSLAKQLQFPYIEMDEVFWEPNWKTPSDEDFFRRLQSRLSAEERWVLDGNYNRTAHLKWQLVDTVIWLDYSFIRTLYQAVKRALRRCLTQEELWKGTNNRESFQKSFFSKDSIILWTIRTYSNLKKRYEVFATDPTYSHVRFVRLKCPRETREFLRTLPAAPTL